MSKYKTFEHFKTLVISSETEVINAFKVKLINKNNEHLLDIGVQIKAYRFGILMQARKIFPSKYGGGSIINIVKKNPEIYSPEQVSDVEKKIKSAFQSSIKKDKLGINEKVMRINLNSAFSKIERKKSPEEDKDDTNLSLKKVFEEEFLPTFKNLYLKEAKEIQKTFKLNKITLLKLRREAFGEILRIVNQDSICKLDRNASSLVRFLEYCIDSFYHSFLEDLGLKDDVYNLAQLREGCKLRFNTCCRDCGKPLLRITKPPYCNKNENRHCYEKYYRQQKKRIAQAQKINALEKEKCIKCKKKTLKPQVHKGKVFCGDSCYEANRKAEYRRKIIGSRA